MLHALCHRIHFLLKGEKDQLIQHSFRGYFFTEIIRLESFKFIDSFHERITGPFTDASE